MHIDVRVIEVLLYIQPVDRLLFLKPVTPYITKTRLFIYIENFTTFQIKYSDTFPISAQTIDCGF